MSNNTFGRSSFMARLYSKAGEVMQTQNSDSAGIRIFPQPLVVVS
jgi:hypothetical protein